MDNVEDRIQNLPQAQCHFPAWTLMDGYQRFDYFPFFFAQITAIALSPSFHGSSS
jgi:hypothetical protein